MFYKLLLSTIIVVRISTILTRTYYYSEEIWQDNMTPCKKKVLFRDVCACYENILLFYLQRDREVLNMKGNIFYLVK